MYIITSPTILFFFTAQSFLNFPKRSCRKGHSELPFFGTLLGCSQALSPCAPLLSWLLNTRQPHQCPLHLPRGLAPPSLLSHPCHMPCPTCILRTPAKSRRSSSCQLALTLHPSACQIPESRSLLPLSMEEIEKEGRCPCPMSPSHPASSRARRGGEVPACSPAARRDVAGKPGVSRGIQLCARREPRACARWKCALSFAEGETGRLLSQAQARRCFTSCVAG